MNGCSRKDDIAGGKKGVREERKNGPFSRLIDLLPRHPIVVMARNENVTLYRLES